MKLSRYLPFQCFDVLPLQGYQTLFPCCLCSVMQPVVVEQVHGGKCAVVAQRTPTVHLIGRKYTNMQYTTSASRWHIFEPGQKVQRALQRQVSLGQLCACLLLCQNYKLPCVSVAVLLCSRFVETIPQHITSKGDFKIMVEF